MPYTIAIDGRCHQDIHIARPGGEATSLAFVYFCARVLMVHEYSSPGQATFYKSIARVKGDVSVN